MIRSAPLRIRLTAWYGSILAAALVFAGCIAWLAMRANLYSAIDADLHDRVLAAAADLEQEVQQHGRGDLRGHLFEHAGADAWQIRASNGTWLYRAAAATENDAPLPALRLGDAAPAFSNIAAGAARFRAAAAAADDGEGGSYTIQIVEPLNPVNAALSGFARTMALASPIVLLAACAGGYWISGRALHPVDRITSTARAITASNLSGRIPLTGSGDELHRLAETVNGMLDRLEQSFARMAQFTADASHELRTPVAFIRATAEVLLRRSRSDAEWRDGVRDIETESARMTKLLDNLMVLARADAGVELCVLQPVDLCAAVGAACRTAAAFARLKGLELSGPTVVQGIEVKGDAALLERLFVILLDNAVKYTPAGGRIDVGIESALNRACVVVRDTGIGISAEDVPRLFERFYRSDKARSRDSGGSGLGLSIARWIVDAHRGSITVESRLGTGSEFRVALPLVS